MKDLIKLINAWNSSRLDLFSITVPNEMGEYFGIIRFYFQAADGKYFSKCIRISNMASARQLVDVLVEKFHPDLNMLPNGRYALYEQNSNFGERRMGADECPLKNQLNFAFGNSEVRYILRDESRLNRSNSFQNMNAPDPPTIPTDKKEKKSSKRNGSKTRKKESSEPPMSKLDPPSKKDKLSKDSSKPENKSMNGNLKKINSEPADEILANGKFRVNCSQVDPVLSNVGISLTYNHRTEDVMDEIFNTNSLVGYDPESYVLVMVSVKKTNPSIQHEKLIQSDEYPLEVYESELKKYGLEYKYEFRLKRKPLILTQKNSISKGDLRSLHSSIISQTQPVHVLQSLNGKKAEYSLNQVLESNNGLTIKIGSSYDVTKIPPNIYIDKNEYPDIRSVHCSILKKKDSNYLIISPALDAFTRPPGPAYLLLNGQRVNGPTALKSGDELKLGNNGLTFRYTIREKTVEEEDIGSQYALQSDVPDRNSLNSRNQVEYSPVIEDDTSVNDNLPLKMDVPMKLRRINEEPSVDPEVLMTISNYLIDHGILTFGKSRPKFKLSLSYSLYLLARLAHRLYYPKNTHHLKDVINQISSQLAGTSQNVSKSNRNGDIEQIIFWLSNTSEFLHIIKNDEDLQSIMTKGTTRSDPEAYSILTSAIDQLFHTLKNITFSSLEHLFAGFLFTGNNDFNDDLNEDENPKNLPEQIRIDPVDVDYSLCDGYLQYLLQASSFLMAKLRKGSVNPYLTFQLFAQLFHAISAWVFNAIIVLENIGEYTWLTRSGAKKIMKRVERVKMWAKRQGLEESAQCYLLKCTQTCELILADRSKLEILYKKCMSSLSLNSLQIEWILAHIHDTPPISEDWVDIIIAGAKEVNDQALMDAAQSPIGTSQESFVSLHESSDLSLPLFVPTDGYAIDANSSQQNFQFRTDSVIEFLRPSVDRNHILLSRNADKENRNLIWNAFMLPTPEDADYQLDENEKLSYNQGTKMAKNNQPIYATSDRKKLNPTSTDIDEDSGKELKTFQPNLDYKRLAKDANIKIENIQPILLRKTSKSIGLSILSAKPVGPNSNYGIYVKDIIPNGSAEADGRIAIGDQLLAIGEESLIGVEKSEDVGQIMQDNVRKDGYVPIVIGKEAAMLHGVYQLLGQTEKQEDKSTLSSSQDIMTRKDNENSDSLSEDIKNMKNFSSETKFDHVPSKSHQSTNQNKDSGFMETDEELSKNTNEKTDPKPVKSEDDEKGLSSSEMAKKSPSKHSPDEESHQKLTDYDSDEMINVKDYSDQDDVMRYRSSLETPFTYAEGKNIHLERRCESEEDFVRSFKGSSHFREPFVEIETQIETSLPPTSNGNYSHLSSRVSRKPNRDSQRNNNNNTNSRDKAIQYFSIYDNSPLLIDNDIYNKSSSNYKRNVVVVDSNSKGSTDLNNPSSQLIYDNTDETIKPVPDWNKKNNSNSNNRDKYLNITSRFKVPSPSPPPMPTADYPQYHPPEKLMQNSKYKHVDLNCLGYNSNSIPRNNNNGQNLNGYSSSATSPIFQKEPRMNPSDYKPTMELYQETSIGFANHDIETPNKKKINSLIDQLIKLESSPNRDPRAIDRLKVEIQFKKDLEERERSRNMSVLNTQRSQSSMSRPYEIMNSCANSSSRPSRLDSKEYDNLEETRDNIPTKNHERFPMSNTNSRNNSLDRMGKKSVSFDRNLATVNVYSPPSNNTTSSNYQNTPNDLLNVTNTIHIRPKQEPSVSASINNQTNHLSSSSTIKIQPKPLERNSNQEIFSKLKEELKDKKRIPHSNSEGEFISLKSDSNYLSTNATTNRNRPENVENLSFKEKIKLFANDIGETELKDRVKASKRQIQIQKENVTNTARAL